MVFGAGADCDCFGAGFETTSASPNPLWRTVPRDAETLPELSPVATPAPNPELATTPRVPWAPSVPLPTPGPPGMSNDHNCEIVTGRKCVLDAGIPLEPPNPPVCTFCGAA